MGDHSRYSVPDLNCTDSLCHVGVAMSSGICATCRHFTHLQRGKRGGLKGICELSQADRYNYENHGWKRSAYERSKCNRYDPFFHEPVLKVTSPHSTTAHAYCPVCDRIIKDFKQESCETCGTLFDWSKYKTIMEGKS